MKASAFSLTPFLPVVLYPSHQPVNHQAVIKASVKVSMIQMQSFVTTLQRYTIQPSEKGKKKKKFS